jgi:hypothetical protein
VQRNELDSRRIELGERTDKLSQTSRETIVSVHHHGIE